MGKKAVSIIVLMLLLLTINVAFNTKPVKAGIITVPDDYPTIQEAINMASPGDTIFVRAGIYYENVVVNKTVSLVGEDKETTIIDAGRGFGVKVVANDTRVSGFTVYNSTGYWPDGAIVIRGFDNVISNNIVIDSRTGIVLWSGGNNTLEDNMIVGNLPTSIGLLFICSSNNTFRNNALVNNSYCNLILEPAYFPWYVQDIDISNTVNGKTIVYLFEKQNVMISPDNYPEEIGTLYLINSTNTIVEGFNISYSEISKCSGADANVWLIYNTNVTIQNNIIHGSDGIFLSSSQRDIFIYNNTIHDTGCGIDGWGERVGQIYIAHNIFHNNINCIMISGSYNVIQENTFYNNSPTPCIPIGTGILVDHPSSQFNVIVGNNITSSGDALIISGSLNTVYGNNIINNSRGIIIHSSSIGNTIAHNNLINNTKQVSVSSEQLTMWDLGYPSGGNYWSDYNGADVFGGVYQNETGSDGIGDVAYTIDANNTDRYPLMAPFSAFNAGVWNGTAYHVDIISNSSLSNFNIDTSGKTVSFNVTGEENQTGFCRITIPNVIVEDLWHGNYTVLLNGEPWPYRYWTDTTNTYIYLNYTHSEHQIILIPEFSSSIALLGFLMLITISLIFTKGGRREKRTKELNFPSLFSDS